MQAVSARSCSPALTGGAAAFRASESKRSCCRKASKSKKASYGMKTPFASSAHNDDGGERDDASRRTSRRALALLAPTLAAASLAPPVPLFSARAANVNKNDRTGAYCDFTQTLPCDEYRDEYERTPAGLLYKDLRYGEGDAAGPGKKVTVDWDGYTFYLSHVVQARNLPKGSDFAENDTGFLKFVVGKARYLFSPFGHMAIFYCF